MSMDRRLWSAEEDQQISRLVAKYGTKKWPIISEKLCAETEYERTGKQCRERWYNHLNPDINNSFWSQQDERRLFEAHKIHGNRWKCISKQFIGRTDNSIKNHFYSTIRRCLRRINKFQGEKNSTLKMRNIKPYVLSKILADRNLTETILEMGKNKPNKNKRDYHVDYFQEFNQMIEKLYEINREYEEVKHQKKTNSNGQSSLRSIEEEEERKEEELESSERSRSEKSFSNKSASLRVSIEKIEGQDDIKGDFNQRLSTSPRLSRKGSKKSKKRAVVNPPTFPKELLFKQTPATRSFDPNPAKRYRRPINYMKLNEGILCEAQRQEIDETNYQSDLSKKKMEQAYDPLSLDISFENGSLEDIIEEEQKSNEKDNLNSIFNPDFIELKPFGSYNISNPSPSFKTINNFQELIVIGTHLKLMPTSSAHNQANEQQRKQSEQEFIEQILEINFDPDEAFADVKEEECENDNDND